MPVTTTQGQVSRHAGIYLQLAVFCTATPSKLRVEVHQLIYLQLTVFCIATPSLRVKVYQLSLDLMDSCVRVGEG